MLVWKLVTNDLHSLNAPEGKQLQYAIGQTTYGINNTPIYTFGALHQVLPHLGPGRRILECEAGEVVKREVGHGVMVTCVTPIKEITQ